MSLTISDEELAAAGLTAEEARLELACRLFQTGKLELWPAAQLAGLSRVEMEGALVARNIPIYIVTYEDLQQDLQSLEVMRAERVAGMGCMKNFSPAVSGRSSMPSRSKELR